MVSVRDLLIDRVAGVSRDDERFIAGLRMIARVGKFIAPAPGHRRQLAMLEAAIDEDSPSIQLIRRLITQCNEKYIRRAASLFVEHSWQGHRRRRRFEEHLGVSVPSFVVISPLAACNLCCHGCYAGAYGHDEPHLSYGDMVRLIEEVRGWGSRFVTISGGEPTLLWRSIPGEELGLRDLLLRYDDMMFLMYTNGTLIDDEMAAEMADLGNISPALSIEGFREQTDARRGKGTFELVVEAMNRLREHRVLFGASVTYTSENCSTVTSERFADLLMDLGCLYAWYFMYVPVGRDPDMSLMVSPEQRRRVAETTWSWLTGRPLFVADFWNSGALTRGCMAAGTSDGYLHVTHRGDICPCVFMMYSDQNLHETDSETPLMDTIRGEFFTRIRHGQATRQNNPLAPCQIVDHPEVLKHAVESTGARETQQGQTVITDLHEAVTERSRRWRGIADELWTRSGRYRGFAEAYDDDPWLPPG